MRPIVPIVWITLLSCTLIGPGRTEAQTRSVFVTSTIHPGNFSTFDPGGLAVADAECNALATGAGLLGTYRAWLSDSTVHAKDRLAPGSGPFINRGGMRVADDIADLTDGSLDRAIGFDENGEAVVGGTAWTGTEATGMRRDGWTCDNWSDVDAQGGLTGDPQAVSSVWTGVVFSASSCKEHRRFYCFEVASPFDDNGAPELIAAVNGPDVTLNWTQADFPPSQGARAPATSYLLKWGRATGILPGIVMLPDVLTFTQRNVPDGTYFTVVHGVRAEQEGPASNEVRIVVGAEGLPGPPGTLTVTVTGDRFTAVWGAAERATRYRFKFGTASGTYPFVSQLGDVLTTSGTINTEVGLFAVVSGVNDVGEGPNSNEAVFSQGCNTRPNAPTGLTNTGPGVNLRWQADSIGCPATSYSLGINHSEFGSPLFPDFVWPDVTETMLSVPGIGPGAKFYVTVRGRNHVGLGRPSNRILVEP